MEEVFSDYRAILETTPDKYYNDLEKIYNQLEDSHAYYKGEVIPFLYQPFFFSNSQQQFFSSIIKQLSSILDKVIQQYVSDPEFRSYFNFSSEFRGTFFEF